MPVRVSDDVLACFRRCPWPGNLRQLANVLRTAAIMAEGAAQIEIEHLPEDFLQDCDDASDDARAREIATEAVSATTTTDNANAAAAPQHRSTSPASPARMEEWQATLIAQTLSRHGGNVSAAARELGLARNTVYRYLRRAPNPSMGTPGQRK